MSRFGAPALFNAPYPPANGMADDANSARESKRPSTESKSSLRAVPPLGEHFSLCVCAVSPPDMQGQMQFADGPTPSEKKKNTQALLDVRGLECV